MVGRKLSRGRKPAVKPEEIELKVLNFQLYDVNNKIKPLKDKIWKDISAAFGGLITYVNIYYYVQQNRHNILTNYNKINGIEETIHDLKNKDEDFEISADDCPQDKPVSKKNKINSKLVVDIVVPPEQWAEIKPVNRQWFDGRIIKKLQEGWTNIVRKLIWDHTKLPCLYSFKNHTVKNFRIEAHGSCIECGAKITLICDTYCRNSESAEFTVETKNTKGIPHKKKIRNQRSKQQTIGNDVLLKKHWRKNKARQNMQQGKQELSNFYKSNQLQRGRRKVTCFQTRKKLVNSLLYLKTTAEFNKFIKEVAVDHFHVMYWSPEQIKFHNEIFNKPDCTFFINATSSLVQKIRKDDENFIHIYLTVICTQIEDKILPVTQLLSEQNDVALYTYWLQNWILSGATVPHCLVTGMDKAIQNAACLAFNSVDFNTYNDVCLHYLLGAEVCIKLSTQMRTDVSHLIWTVKKWPCFNEIDSSIKKVFLKCIRFANAITNLKQFENFFKNVLIISLSKFVNDGCRIALNNVNAVINQFCFEDEDAIDKEANEKVLAKSTNSKLTMKYIENLTNEILPLTTKLNESCTGNQLNDYYSPDFAASFCSLCVEFPSWTNVMSAYFESNKTVIKSSVSDKYFSQLKRSHNNLSADDFVIQHCTKINSDFLMDRVLSDQNLKMIIL